LSYIHHQDVPLSSLYEEIFIKEEFDGTKLSFCAEKDFLKLGISALHSQILNQEVEKLIQHGSKNSLLKPLKHSTVTEQDLELKFKICTILQTNVV
jgi:hypothetical protein